MATVGCSSRPVDATERRLGFPTDPPLAVVRTGARRLAVTGKLLRGGVVVVRETKPATGGKAAPLPPRLRLKARRPVRVTGPGEALAREPMLAGRVPGRAVTGQIP